MTVSLPDMHCLSRLSSTRETAVPWSSTLVWSKKLRHGDIEWLIWGSTARKWQAWDFFFPVETGSVSQVRGYKHTHTAVPSFFRAGN